MNEDFSHLTDEKARLVLKLDSGQHLAINGILIIQNKNKLK